MLLPDADHAALTLGIFDARHFPFPGKRNGTYDLGARHDWVHVLAGYDTTPEGEIDMFSFIASMPDDRGERLRRGHACNVDVMGELDLFAHKDESLDGVRTRFAIPPLVEVGQ